MTPPYVYIQPCKHARMTQRGQTTCTHVTGQFSGVPTRLVHRFAVNGGLDLTRKFRRRLFSATHMQIFSISLLKLLVCCTFNSLFGIVHSSFGWSRLLLKNFVVFCLHFQELAIKRHVTCVSGHSTQRHSCHHFLFPRQCSKNIWAKTDLFFIF